MNSFFYIRQSNGCIFFSSSYIWSLSVYIIIHHVFMMMIFVCEFSCYQYIYLYIYILMLWSVLFVFFSFWWKTKWNLGESTQKWAEYTIQTWNYPDDRWNRYSGERKTITSEPSHKSESVLFYKVTIFSVTYFQSLITSKLLNY